VRCIAFESCAQKSSGGRGVGASAVLWHTPPAAAARRRQFPARGVYLVCYASISRARTWTGATS